MGALVNLFFLAIGVVFTFPILWELILLFFSFRDFVLSH